MAKSFVIWNPAAGRAAEAAHVRDKLLQQKHTVVCETTAEKTAEKLAAEAASAGFDLVVAAGGDGTVNQVANGLAASRSRATLAVLPLGTANDFAFTLGLPDDLDTAADLIWTGPRRAMDLVEIDGGGQTRWFANVASGGNSDRVTAALTDELKQTWGPLCYLRGAIGVLADLASYQATVQFDDEPAYEVSVWNVIVANGRTNGGRLKLAPQASPEDGLLDIILIRDGTLLDLASLATQFALSSYLESDQVIYRQARSFAITAQPPIYFSLDGEVLADPPRMFRVHPHALPMVVGPAYEAE